MGCKSSDQQRYLRHREIAELVKDLPTIDDEQSLSSPITPKAPKFDFAVLDGSASKKDRKEAKRQAKAADRVLEIKAKDVERIGKILHPGEPVDEEFERGLLMDKSIEENVYYHPQTSNTREERQIFISKDRRGKGDFKVTAAEIERIMVELRIHDVSHLNGKKERALVGRLRDKIVEDLEHEHGEVRETMIRKAGFWRWASRKTYNRLAENGRIWDWDSGEALAPVVEHDADVVDPQAVAGAKPVAANGEEAVDYGPLVVNEDEIDDLGSLPLSPNVCVEHISRHIDVISFTHHILQSR